MKVAKYICPKCHQSDWATSATAWRCEACGQSYLCFDEVPRLYLEDTVKPRDRQLRDRFYDGFVGKFYQYTMPFLSLPVRPLKLSWRDWLVYAVASLALVLLTLYLADLVLIRRGANFGFPDALFLGVALAAVVFFVRHAYIFHLFVLAIPTRISLLQAKFTPAESFSDVHRRVIGALAGRGQKLQVLDISTGNCASLYKHGWMGLDAEFTGVDLSETMLRQGISFMAAKHIPIEFALADAMNLPFVSETFDVVLNYGAVNSMSDPAQALREMARVAKPGGLVLFLDEQLYEAATAVESRYFKKVLSSHNVVHRCPVDRLPQDLEDVKVHQVYHFYYICEATKAGPLAPVT